MALHPHDDDPIRAEGLRLLAEDPELAADIEDFNRRLNAGEIDSSELYCGSTWVTSSVC